MQRAHHIVVEMHKEGCKIDYDVIAKRVARTLPGLKSMIPEITKYVELWSGALRTRASWGRSSHWSAAARNASLGQHQQ